MIPNPALWFFWWLTDPVRRRWVRHFSKYEANFSKSTPRKETP